MRDVTIMDTEQDKDLDQLLNEHFTGRVVRKDLTKLIKEGANVPVYVLEYLLGMYCASNDPVVIEQGLKNVKTVLAENYVRPDEAEKVKSLVRERGTYKVIDRVTVRLNEKKDRYEASFSSLGIRDAEISASIVKEYEKLTKENGYFHQQRTEQLVKIFYDWMENTLKDNFYGNQMVKDKIEDLIPKIKAGQITPYQAGAETLKS